MSGLEDEPAGVTIKEVAPPQGSSGTAPVSGSGLSVREVYTQDGPGVVSVDVAATSDLGPGGGSGFVVDEAGRVLAVGRALLSSGEMLAFKTGVAVKIRHGSAEESQSISSSNAK